MDFALVNNPSIKLAYGVERVTPGLVFLEDLTDDLEPSDGDVAWDGTADVHRTLAMSLARRLSWGTDLVRIFCTATDYQTSETQRSNLGVFKLDTPVNDFSQQILDKAGKPSLLYKVTGQDRLALMRRQIGQSYSVATGTVVLTAIQQVFIAAGVTGVRYNTTAISATVPSPMVFPLIASNATTSDPSDNTAQSSALPMPADYGGDGNDTVSGPYMWVDVVNELLKLINYRALYCDNDGYFQVTPYVDPGLRLPQATFDSDDELTSNIEPENRTTTEDMYSTPNRWIFVWANIPDDAGEPAVPALGAGLYVVDNTDDGPSSQNQRGGDKLGVYPTQIQITAASQDDFVAQCDARVASDKRGTATATATTVPYPDAGHFDVFTWNDSNLDGGTWKVEAMQWQTKFDGSGTTWTFAKVA